MAETQLKVVENVFPVIQLIVTFVQYLLTVLKVKNNYNASAFPLAFAMIAVVFILLKDGKITDSSPKDWLLANIQPMDTICSTSTEFDRTWSSDNQLDTLSSVVKRSTHVRNKRVAFELELNDDKANKKAMESIFGIQGVDSI